MTSSVEPEKITIDRGQQVRDLANAWGAGLQTLVELDDKRKRLAPDDLELKESLGTIAREFGRIGADLNEVCIEVANEEAQVDG